MPDGSRYIGDWSEIAGVKTKHGQGVLISGTETYTGGWEQDMMNGIGEYKFGSGAVYRGGFKNNLFEGDGTYTFADGSSYVGQWQGNKMHGKGVHTSATGFVVNGEFVNGIYKSADRSAPSPSHAVIHE